MLKGKKPVTHPFACLADSCARSDYDMTQALPVNVAVTITNN